MPHTTKMIKSLQVSSLCEIVSHHIFDWVGAFVLWGIVAVVNFLTGPNDRFFYPPPSNASQPFDTTIGYPNLEDTVPMLQLSLVVLALVVVTVVVVQLVFVYGLQRMNWSVHLDVHHFVLSLFAGYAVAMFFTVWLKHYAGRKRPDYYARLATNDDEVIKEGEMSYPSGHSSTSMFFATALAMYVAGKMRLLVESNGRFSVFKVMVICLYLSYGAFVAASRTRDYKHNFSDINAGGFIGICAAILAYFMYFKSLFEDDCDYPKGASGKVIQSRVSDLEEGSS